MISQDDPMHLAFTAEEAIEWVQTLPVHAPGELRIDGIISDQDEARRFLKWLLSPEGRARLERFRAKPQDTQASAEQDEL